jgi:hypothetical protein
MKLSEQNRDALLLDIHLQIEIEVERAFKSLANPTGIYIINYPPNGGFTEEEINYIKKMDVDDRVFKNIIRKIIADAIGTSFCAFFSNIDGTGDPDSRFGDWRGVNLVDSDCADFEEYNEKYESLMHKFFDLYWNWKNLRDPKEWKLDNY